MNVEQLTSQVSASNQISVKDVSTIADMGVELLVCNRPDNEDEGQISYDAIAKEATKQGMQAISLPFSSYQITEANRDELITLIETRKRIHLYCRSGSRCKRLWREANSVVGGEKEYNKMHSST